METSVLSVVDQLPTVSLDSKGDGAMSGVITATGALNILTVIQEEYSTKEHILDIELSPLAGEDLSGSWWRNYDPPKELFWTSEDRYRLREMSLGDCLGRLEVVLKNLQVGIPEEELGSNLVPTASVDINGGVTLPYPGRSQNRPQLSISSVSSDNRSSAEIASPVSPITSPRSSSVASSNSVKSKNRQGRGVSMSSLVYTGFIETPRPPVPLGDRRRSSTLETLRPETPHSENSNQETPRLATPRSETWRSETSCSETPYSESKPSFWSRKIKCVSCKNNYKKRKLVVLECSHQYCDECIASLIKNAFHNEAIWPPSCCRKEIPQGTIKSTLSKKDQQIFNKKVTEHAIPAAERRYCPRSSCRVWIPPTAAREISCPLCRSVVCRECGGLAHSTQEQCPAHISVSPLDKRGQEWRKCFQCQTMVLRTVGSNYMTCICNTDFCYSCGVVWGACYCQASQDEHRQRARGGQVTTGQAVYEWDKVQVQTVMGTPGGSIISFEEAGRELAAKSLAERLKRRESELREQLAAEERDLQEKWVGIVVSRYDRLRKEIENLDRRQWNLMQERHRNEQDKLEIARDILGTQGVEKLAIDMGLLEERRSREIEEHRIMLERERELLRSKQVAEEDEYWFSLQSYLNGRPNREERQRVLMEKFTATQAEAMHALQQQQLVEMSELNTRLEAQLSVVESTLKDAHEAERLVIETKIKDRARHHYAEKQWFETTRSVRQVILTQSEEVIKFDDIEREKYLSGLSLEPVEMGV